MDDPRSKIINEIDIASCRVTYSTEPVVLLFGGKVTPPKKDPDDEDTPILSLRDAIVRFHSNYEVYHPEKIDDWLYDGVYKHLVSFEKDLASICSLLVVVSESEGAIAELALFSQVPEITNKMIVFSTSDHVNQASFISLGIYRYLKELKKKNKKKDKKKFPAVRSYPWEINHISTLPDNVIENVLLDIQDKLDVLPDSAKFDVQNDTHLMVIIYELIVIFVALKEGEISNYVKSLGFDLRLDELKRKLFLMIKFQLIIKDDYGDTGFYIAGKNDFHRLTLSKRLDRMRISMSCLDYYNEERNERHRRELIKKHSDLPKE